MPSGLMECEPRILATKTLPGEAVDLAVKVFGFDSFLTASRGRSHVARAALRVGRAGDLQGHYDDIADDDVIVEEGRVALLRTLIVAAQWRGRGFGAHLFEEACQIARRRGAMALYVHAVALDGGGDPTGFYRKRGMEIVDFDSCGRPYLRAEI